MTPQTQLTVLHTVHQLTPGELWRLLHSYRLPQAVRDLIFEDLAEDESYRWELVAEGHPHRPSALDCYLALHPEHTCAPPPFGWHQDPFQGWVEEELPF